MIALEKMETSALWQAFASDRDPHARERLAMAYLPLVRDQVRTCADRAPGKAEEIERYGLIGLLKAIDMFDPHRGVPFEPFARQRIRGAISDYLRTLRLRSGRAAEGRTVPAALLRDAGVGSSSSAVDSEMWRAIEALSPSQKLVIGLHYCEGVTLEEVGRVLGISRRGVRALRVEALHSVRTHLSVRSWLDGDPPARAQAGTL